MCWKTQTVEGGEGEERVQTFIVIIIPHSSLYRSRFFALSSNVKHGQHHRFHCYIYNINTTKYLGGQRVNNTSIK